MRIGIDLGGTKIEGIALMGGDEAARIRVATPRGDYEATLAAVVDLVEDLEGKIGKRATIGIGIPGVISPATGLVKNANSTWLLGRPLLADLEARLGRPIRIANDANCFAISEATDGAAADDEVVFGVILGTGVGGGIVVNRRVLTGANAVAGEWGHNPLPWPSADEQPGPPCYCGRHGCIETFLSGPGLVEDYRRRTGQSGAASTIVDRARQGDADAGFVLGRYEDRLARALASVINLLDPDTIVLGGGLSNIDRLCTGVLELWGRYVFSSGADASINASTEREHPSRSDPVRTRLIRARHGDSSGVRGAAWLWPDEGSHD